jgi:hypothetical protein
MNLTTTNWSNSGQLNHLADGLTLAGAFTTASLGGFARTGGNVNLNGTLDLLGGSLNIGSAGFFGTGGLSLLSGIIKNGTLISSDGTALTTSGSRRLDGISIGSNLTVNGELDIYHGLTLANGITGRDINSSFDFGIYDDQVVTDVFPQSGKYYGRKTTTSVEVEKYVKLFEIINHNAHAVILEDDRIILASEALRLAA